MNAMCYRRWCKQHGIPFVAFRGWRLSPLFCWGKWTLHFSNGICFGRLQEYGENIYYIGRLIIAHQTSYYPEPAQQTKGGWMYIVKYGHGPGEKGKWAWKFC